MRTIEDGRGGPPYRLVASAIRDAIRDGEFPPATPIPSRADLVAHFNVAPMTITAAVRILREEGWVVGR